MIIGTLIVILRFLAAITACSPPESADWAKYYKSSNDTITAHGKNQAENYAPDSPEARKTGKKLKFFQKNACQAGEAII